MRREAGWTLVEVLAVLFILAILAGLSAPVVVQMARADRLRSASTAVSGALLRARSLAISSGEIYCMRLTPWSETAPARACVYRVSEEDLASIASWGVADWEVRLSGSLALPPETQCSSGGAYLMFLPDGSAAGPSFAAPPTPAFTVLPAPGYEHYAYDESQETAVHPITGRIVVGPRKLVDK
jgi:prepilin-type N-terminal cleavage/methylation domain-containing protein